MYRVLLIILLCIPLGLLAQEEEDSKKKKKPKNWALNGYVKYMPSVLFLHAPAKLMLQDNLVHNRLNFKWYISKAFTFKMDLRTRLFFGEVVKQTPNYADLVKNANRSANGYEDYLSWILLDENAAVIHSTIDRLYLQYSKDKWDITLGRQRINWGINTIWNPNDIFNTYSFTDFDYEERPGSDALRIQYFTGVASRIEFAAKVFTKWEKATAAFLWKTNKWNYDFQLLGGLLGQDIVVGGGWAGNIKLVGFKGELAYFYNFADTTTQRHSFSATVSFDYIFPSKTYLNGGLLYNMNGLLSSNTTALFSLQPSPKNLYPYRYSVFLSVMHPFTERFSGALTMIYSPGESHALFVTPTFTYTIDERWDIALVGQIALQREAPWYVSPTQAIFLRIKLSF